MNTEPDFSELSAEAQGRVDDVCDALEAAWQKVVTRAGTGHGTSAGWPEIDSFVAKFSGRERVAALRELVPIDVSYRRQCGAPIAIGDYARFTELDSEWLADIVLDPDGATRRLPVPSSVPSQPAPKPKLPPPTWAVFVERLVRSGVFDRQTLDREITSVPQGDSTAATLGERLVSRGLLTPFQLDSLLRTAKPGLVLGEYVILSPLGRGGMGAVYKARHRRMDRLVALKVLPSSAAHDPHAASRFSREIRAVSRLSHPNIVAAHDAGEDSGVAYLVMECIDGTDLSSCVRTHGPLSVAHAVESVAQAAEGLEYAHRQGVIHRDIKPSNLILCHAPVEVLNGTGEPGGNETSERGDNETPERGGVSPLALGRKPVLEKPGGLRRPAQKPHTVCHVRDNSDDATHSPHARAPSALRIKVLDLGLARFSAEALTPQEGSALTRTGVMFGTPEYMSPEQAVSASTADARSDIYSLGCTLYFLLTGRTVVSGQSFLEMVMAHQLQALPSLVAARDDVPAELEQVFRRMTARRADQRFASMLEVRDALRAIPSDRLSQVPGAVTPTINATTTPAHAATAGHATSTDWLSPLEAADQGGEATVLFTDLDSTATNFQRRSTSARFIAWAKSNRSVSITLAALLACVVIAGVAGLWTRFGDQATLAKQPDSVKPPAAPQRVPRPEPLPCPANSPLVQQRQREWATYLGAETTITNSIGLILCLIPPGEFTMGTSDAELNALSDLGVPRYEIAHSRDEQPAHRVQLTKPFWIGQTEVTVSQFRRFVEAEHFVTETEQTAGYGLVQNQWVLRSGFSWKEAGEATLTDNHPASNITWNDAVAFCEWLSRHESHETSQSVRYRLPTEAEWEFACRAGTETPWFFGSDARVARDYAISAGNSTRQLQPVGSRLENPFHLFDVLGNQAEWCQDWFAAYGSADGLVTDPTGPLNGQERVQRGGNFGDLPPRLRSAARQSRPPSSPRDGSLRVVREVDTK